MCTELGPDATQWLGNSHLQLFWQGMDPSGFKPWSSLLLCVSLPSGAACEAVPVTPCFSIRCPKQSDTTRPNHVALGMVLPVLLHSWESSSATTSSPQKALPNMQSSLSTENSVLALSAETRAGLKREGKIGPSIRRGRHGHGTLPQEACPHHSPSGWHAGNRRAVITGKNQVMRNRTRDRTDWHWDF